MKSREGDRRARSRVETAGPPAERVSEGAGRDHPDRTYRGKELPRQTKVVFSSYFFFSLRWLSGTQAWQLPEEVETLPIQSSCCDVQAAATLRRNCSDAEVTPGIFNPRFRVKLVSGYMRSRTPQQWWRSARAAAGTSQGPA